MKNLILVLLFLTAACKPVQKTVIPPWVSNDETEELVESSTHEAKNMRFKLIQSKILDKNDIWKNIETQIADFKIEDYQRLKSFILEQDIPTIQAHIKSGVLTYKHLTQWYLFRIVKFENDKNKTLNNIIAVNPNAVNEAIKRDKNKSAQNHPIFGMPIIIKDNINMAGLPTTAGTHLLRNNRTTSNAFIIDRIKEKGGIILAKSNLSEWANYLCSGCPNGYSAAGGQTLNPYARKLFDTGGSSSGSGSTMAANYATASVGTETSGSILSPSSANSIVGLKPTTGLLSRNGIVPLSSTLDTPGPMTRNVIDSAILLSAMSGEDPEDAATKNNPKGKNYLEELKNGSLKGVRFGVNKSLLKDSIYMLNIEKIIALGGIAIEFEPEQINFDGFGALLNADMKIDLPKYLNKYASNEIKLFSIADIVDYNKKDSLLKIPYGQARFEGILAEKINDEDLSLLKIRLHEESVSFFEKPLVQFNLDVILSINNRNAGYAAAANYPCITIPMGYEKTGKPIGITIIGRPYEEDKILKIGYAFEQATKYRKLPENYN
ncbi:amidase family protein [Lutibacter sp.]|uniref:amidase family protein n=1 Tax=Lutibacter sp. TaxID=1925666 RepID=UPI0027324036|nr:amidase family protein [Lutibacter sp.]MDP3313794.1 amidase family protein [Lutibacter sp.]